ncbi:unnamed protein product [Polarella glacialis]|uniref:tRNA:m(4)X modification enzyme TRM13 n=1 Tax=Polarella glacialis TaxID=89957 RepID=A0A813FKI4_POLGL|nr:unnamed protein product [Polarella glacialis]
MRPDVVVLHDLSMLPDQATLNLYAYQGETRVRAFAAAHGKYKTDGCFGGVLALCPAAFEAANGFPNNLPGCGCENSALQTRLKKAEMSWTHSFGEFESNLQRFDSQRDPMVAVGDLPKGQMTSKETVARRRIKHSTVFSGDQSFDGLSDEYSVVETRVKQNADEARRSCEECGKVFSTRSQLFNHLPKCGQDKSGLSPQGWIKAFAAKIIRAASSLSTGDACSVAEGSETLLRRLLAAQKDLVGAADGDETSVLDLGAGKALFTRALYESFGRRVPVIALDVLDLRDSRKDSFFDPAEVRLGEAPYTRIVTDLRTPQWVEGPELKGPIVAVTKHLCGGATDAALVQEGTLHGSVLPPETQLDCNKAYLEEIGFATARDFRWLLKLLQISCHKTLKEFEYRNHAILQAALPFEEVKQLGRCARRVVEEGRARYLRDRGFDVTVFALSALRGAGVDTTLVEEADKMVIDRTLGDGRLRSAFEPCGAEPMELRHLQGLSCTLSSYCNSNELWGSRLLVLDHFGVALEQASFFGEAMCAFLFCMDAVVFEHCAMAHRHGWRFRRKESYAGKVHSSLASVGIHVSASLDCTVPDEVASHSKAILNLGASPHLGTQLGPTAVHPAGGSVINLTPILMGRSSPGLPVLSVEARPGDGMAHLGCHGYSIHPCIDARMVEDSHAGSISDVALFSSAFIEARAAELSEPKDEQEAGEQQPMPSSSDNGSWKGHIALQSLRGYSSKVGCRRALWVCPWGALGAFALDTATGEAFFEPARAAGEVVDTLGAGDTFNAACLHALALGATAQEALRSACTVAGKKVSQHGIAGLGSSVPSDMPWLQQAP